LRNHISRWLPCTYRQSVTFRCDPSPRARMKSPPAGSCHVTMFLNRHANHQVSWFFLFSRSWTILLTDSISHPLKLNIRIQTCTSDVILIKRSKFDLRNNHAMPLESLLINYLYSSSSLTFFWKLKLAYPIAWYILHQTFQKFAWLSFSFFNPEINFNLILFILCDCNFNLKIYIFIFILFI